MDSNIRRLATSGPADDGASPGVRATPSSLDAQVTEALRARAPIVEDLWRALVDSLDEKDPNTNARVRSAEVRLETRLPMAASTGRGEHYVVSVDMGIIEGLVECSRALAGEEFDPAFRGPVGASSAFEEVGLRIGHVLSWLSSVASFPVPTPGHHLSEEGETFARWLATGAILFILAHELGHVIADDGTPRPGEGPYSRELRADQQAFTILDQWLSSASASTEVASRLARAPMSSDLFRAGALMFLSFDGLLRLVCGTANGSIQIPWPSDAIAATATPGHPSPFARINEIMKAVREVESDGNLAQNLEALLLGFDSLRPTIERNLPEWKLSEEDARAWVQATGFEPEYGDRLVGRTIGDVCSRDVIELLRDAARRGGVTSDQIRYLESAAGNNPRPIINTLAYAVAGQLPSTADPEAESIWTMARRVAERIEPLLLRFAIRDQRQITLHSTSSL